MSKVTLIGKQIERDYLQLMQELGQINGMIYHTRSVYKNYIESFKEFKFQRDGFLFSRLYFYSPLDGNLVDSGSRIYEVGKHNLQTSTSVLLRKSMNYYTLQSYEAFESFLRLITARLITKYKKQSLSFDEKLGFSNVNSCKLFLASQYKNNLDLIVFLKYLLPDLKDAFSKNKRLQSYLHFYKAYTTARHCIVHTNEKISKSAKAKLKDSQDVHYLENYFLDSSISNIIDTTHKADRIVSQIASLAHLIITSFNYQNPKVLNSK